MRRIYALVSGLVALALLAVAVPVAPAQAQSTTPPTLVFQANVPNISVNKFPDVAASGRLVHIASNRLNRDAVYVSKGDSANTFSTPEVLGDAPDQADYSPAVVAAGPDGSVHFAWLNIQTRQIRYRSRPAGGAWGPARLVATPSGFPANIDLGVATDGSLFVVWRISDSTWRVRRSTDGGVSWSSDFVLGARTGEVQPDIAIGPGGRVAIAVTVGEGDFLQIYIAIWNGAGFTLERVSPFNASYANPTATYDSAGNLNVLFRGTEDAPTSGVWLATSPASGQWQPTRIVSGNVKDTVNVRADSQNNLHLTWITDVGGALRLFYSFRAAGATNFTTPIDATAPGGVIFNARSAANIGDRAYAHTVTETFQGSVTNVRYFLHAAVSLPTVGGTPVVEDGKPIVAKKTTLAVRFDNVQGTPTQIRWRWGEAPTDSTTDSNGWVNYANPLTIPLPESILANTPCSAEKLFVQMREANGNTGSPQSADVNVDTGVNAALAVSNPYVIRKAPIFTPAEARIMDVGTGGASDGDPGYTRDPIYYVALAGVSDCSGVQDISFGRSTTTVAKAIPLSNESFANVLPYPGVMNPGPNQLLVRVSDKAGNVADYTQTIVLDRTKPVLATPGTLTVASDARATILTRLTFSGVSVTDNVYPGRGFWGVWIANSRTQVANPATDTTLNWMPVQAPGSSADFTLANWSLATGLSGALQPGQYFVYVRFLDGAGNPTDGVLTGSVTLAQVTRPQVALPLMRR
jgi:hypothetical protein